MPTLLPIPPRPADLPTGQWTEAALRVLRERYLLKDPRGTVIETPEELCWRVAWTVAQAEHAWDAHEGRVKTLARAFYELMARRELLPNSPTLMNAGKGQGLTLAACYALPIEDSIPGIFGTLGKAAVIQKSGGGTGFSFSRLRPKGSRVRSSGGTSSGPISFLRDAYDHMTDAVKQGSTRRGANMAILRCDHPDLLEFIDAKRSGGITNFNISVAITDEFMAALDGDASYPLRARAGWPRPDGSNFQDGEPYLNPETGQPMALHAREVWDQICRAAWATGDPGLFFIDRTNRWRANPVPSRYQVETTNPSMPAGTPVATREGIFPIEALEGRTFQVKSPDGTWAPAECFLSGPAVFLYDIEVGRHKVLRATAEHRWPVLDPADAAIIKKTTVELRPGDWLLRHRAEPAGFLADTTLTEKDGFFLGYLFGEGWISQRTSDRTWAGGITFSVDKCHLAERLLTYVNEHKGAPARLTERRHASEFQIQFTEQPFLTWLIDRFGWRGKTQLPMVVWASNDAFVRGFVDGLLSADGSVNANRICLVSAHRRVAREFSQLLGFYGVGTSISGRDGLRGSFPNRKTYTRTYSRWAVSISALHAQRFRKIFSLSHHKKASALASMAVPRPSLWGDHCRVTRVERTGRREAVWDLRVHHEQHAFPCAWVYTGNCGEQPLYPNDQCSLGSMNLAAFVDSAARGFDWDRLAAAVGLATRFLDNVLEVSPPPTPEIGEMVRAIRRIGLGVMGWADALIRLGVPYDSEEAVALAEKVMGFITKTAEQTSVELAQTRGAFPLWPESIYRDGPPRRNSTVTTIAPTGSLSILAGCSSGIEPLYAVAFTHTVRRSEGDRILHLVNPLFESLARTRGIYNERLMNDIAKRGTVRGLPDVPEDLQRLFGTAHEIDPAWHVRHQAAFQAHTCNGVSKTANLPHSATIEDVSRAYRLAWDLGCLGITVFRDGCKGEQVLTVGTSATPAIPKSSGPAAGPGPTPDDAPLVRPRPPRLEGPTFKVETPLGAAYVTVTLQDGEPLEVFVNIGKSGTDTGAFAEALGRLVSTLLRLQRLPGRTDRAREVIDQLSQIGGSRDVGYGPKRIRSVPDAIAWALGQALQPAPDLRQLALPSSTPTAGNNPAPHRLGDLCPTCGAAAVVWEEGCRHCLACGLYSEC